MSIRTYADLQQGTDEWIKARRGIVTASVVGQLVTARTIKPAANDYSRYLTARLVAERITGEVEEQYVSADMWRGKLDEPVARQAYHEIHSPVTEVGFIRRDEQGWTLGYSPDGLVGDDGLIEIKSRDQKRQLQTILADAVPAENMAQLQAGLLVTGRAWIDYVSFCGGMPLWVKRVQPDQRWFEAITDAVTIFEQTAVEMLAAYRAAVKDLPVMERVAHDIEVTV